MRLETYENNREQTASGISINKSAGDFTRAGYAALAKGINAIGVEAEAIQKQVDDGQAMILAAKRYKIAELYKQNVLDNSQNGKVNGSLLAKYDNNNGIVDFAELAGANIHDAMDTINKKIDEYASTKLSRAAYQKYKDITLDATVRDTIQAHAIWRQEHKNEQKRLVSNTLSTYMSNVQVAKHPIAAAQSSEAQMTKYLNTVRYNTFMSAEEKSAITKAAHEALFETAVKGAIRKGQYDEAALQLGITPDMLEKIPEEKFKQWGVFWDKEHNLLRYEDTKVKGRNPSSITKGSQILKPSKGFEKFRLKGWTTYSTNKKDILIGQVLRGMAQKQEADATSTVAAFKDAVHATFSGKLTAEASNKINDLAKKLHTLNVKPEVKAQLFAQASFAMAYNQQAAHIQDWSPDAIAEATAKLNKNINNIKPKELFGDLMNDPDFKLYATSPAFMSQFKDNVMGMWKRTVAAHMKERNDNIAGYTLKYNQPAYDAYKDIDKLGKELALATQARVAAQRENDLEHIKKAEQAVKSAKQGLDFSAREYLYTAKKYQESLGIPRYQQKFIPQTSMEQVIPSINAAFDSNDMHTIEAAMGSIEGLTANRNPTMLRSFVVQAGKKIPPVVAASLYIEDPHLRSQLLSQTRNIKDAIDTSGVNKKELDKAITENDYFQKVTKILLKQPNNAYNQRFVGALANMVKVGSAEFLHEEGEKGIEKSVDKYLKGMGTITRGQFITNYAMHNLGQTHPDLYIDYLNEKIKTMKSKPSKESLDMYAALKKGPEYEWKDLDAATKKEYLKRFNEANEVRISPEGELQFINTISNTPIGIELPACPLEKECNKAVYTVDPEWAREIFPMTPQEMRRTQYIQPVLKLQRHSSGTGIL